MNGILLPAGARAALTAVPAVLEDAAATLPSHLRYALTAMHAEVLRSWVTTRSVAAIERRAALKQPLTRLQQWAVTLAERRGHNKAAIAMANKLARIVWGVWHRDEPFAAAAA